MSYQNYYEMDHAMKHSLNNDLPVGGKLAIADGDPHQLSLITGNFICVPSCFLFSLDLILLKYCVRLSSNSILHATLQITRKSSASDEES